MAASAFSIYASFGFLHFPGMETGWFPIVVYLLSATGTVMGYFRYYKEYPERGNANLAAVFITIVLVYFVALTLHFLSYGTNPYYKNMTFSSPTPEDISGFSMAFYTVLIFAAPVVALVVLVAGLGATTSFLAGYVISSKGTPFVSKIVNVWTLGRLGAALTMAHKK